MTKPFKLNVYELKNETWEWQGKSVKIGKMNIGQLEQCLNFIKSNKVKSNIFGKPKEHWKDVFSQMITHKSNSNINYIISQMNEHRVKVITQKINNLTINKTNLKHDNHILR